MPKKTQLPELEEYLDQLKADLKRVGGGVPLLTDTPRAMKLMLNPEQDAMERTRYILGVMYEGGQITGALTPECRMSKGRFMATTLGSEGNLSGLVMMCFSREFVELERQIVATRAKILALESGLDISKLEALNDEEPAHPGIKLVGSESDWEGAAERARILYTRNCIQSFGAASTEELREGKILEVPLHERTLEYLGAASQKSYPDPVQVKTYIDEKQVDGRRVKQLIAIPLTK